MSQADDKALVVSLHDVSPFTWDACRRILDELAQLQVSPVSLLVIPDHHGRGNFSDNPEFCDWLKTRVADGDEPVLHGYRHQQECRSIGSLIIPNTGFDIYCGTEAEFYGISFETAAARLSRGAQSFQKTGIVAKGFIAPAWLLGADAERAVRKAGFQYTTRVSGVLDFQSGRFHRSRSLCWSTRSAWRRVMSLAWNAALYRRLTDNPLLRIAIHPPDITHPKIWSQIVRLITAARSERTPHSYATWFAIAAQPE